MSHRQEERQQLFTQERVSLRKHSLEGLTLWAPWAMMKTLFCVTLTQNQVGNESKCDDKDREPYEQGILLGDLNSTTRSIDFGCHDACGY